MAHAYPYSFKFTDYEGKEDTVCILVHFERTRSKSYVFRTQTNWDAEKNTQLEFSDEATKAGDVDTNDLFWASMRKAAIMGLCEHGCLEDSMPEDKMGYEYGNFIKSIVGRCELSDLISFLPPELKIQAVDNGWN